MGDTGPGDRMNLIPNAAEVFYKSWAVRLAFVTAILTSIVALLPQLPPEIHQLPYFDVVAHWLLVAFNVATAISRVIAQPNMPGPKA